MMFLMAIKMNYPLIQDFGKDVICGVYGDTLRP